MKHLYSTNLVARDSFLLHNYPPIGKNNSTFNLQTDIICTGYGGTNEKALVHNFEDMVAGRNLASITPHVPSSWQHVLGFALIRLQGHVSRLAFSWTLGFSNIHIGMRNDLNIGVYVSNWRPLLNLVPLRYSPAFHTTISMIKMKRMEDKTVQIY